MSCTCKDPKPALVWSHMYPPPPSSPNPKDAIEARVHCPGCGAFQQIGGRKPDDEELRPMLWMPTPEQAAAIRGLK